MFVAVRVDKRCRQLTISHTLPDRPRSRRFSSRQAQGIGHAQNNEAVLICKAVDIVLGGQARVGIDWVASLDPPAGQKFRTVVRRTLGYNNLQARG